MPQSHLRMLHAIWLLAVLLSSCSNLKETKNAAWIAPTLAPTASHTPVPTNTVTPSPTPSPTASPTQTMTSTPTPSATPTKVPTPTWVEVAPGEATVPILLYHHIDFSATNSRYYVTPEVFEQQMRLLKAWGCETITPTQLAEVLLHGGSLPARAVVITFDDGDLDVYQNAFPILKELGYVATMYVVSSYLNQPNFINIDQLKEMSQAGWEIGSHSSNHADLTLNYNYFYQEMVQSRLDIEAAIGIKVHTFAYPYGRADANVLKKSYEYGYVAGMGLGTSNTHYLSTLYYLSRREVQSNLTLEAFSAFFPWYEPDEDS